MWAAAIPAAIQAAGSIAGGYLSSRGNKESETQRTQRKLVDKLISSLSGKGQFSDLYSTDESAFQKSFVEPAQARFRNQIAPQIQQQYIAGGQQRGTGLEDQLLRAGIDLNSLLNESYLGYQEKGKDRMQNTISNILGLGSGAPPEQSIAQNLAQSTGGYLASDAFKGGISDIYQAYNKQPSQPAQIAMPPVRKGFEQDWRTWNLGDSRWGQQ